MYNSFTQYITDIHNCFIHCCIGIPSLTPPMAGSLLEGSISPNNTILIIYFLLLGVDDVEELMCAADAMLENRMKDVGFECILCSG